MNPSGVLLVNLGSPDSPAVGDVRRYLREFLMDERVIDSPYPVRWFVVNCMILPRRPKQSAHAYQSIWLPEGSPLVVSGQRVRTLLQERVPMPVELAMRYQNPSVQAALTKLQAAGVKNLFVVPMFPHYAMSSYETAVEHVRKVAAHVTPGMELQVLPPYYDEPHYIEALVDSASQHLSRPYDHLLFSFHGLPERHLRKSDPTCGHCLRVERCCETESEAHRTCYRVQCFKTVDAFVKKASVVRYSTSFQSRLGREPWLQPYTDQEIARLARDGIKRLVVMCPAFVADCLETLEEIGMRGREIFEQAGGQEFRLVPCLNEHPRWIDALETYVRRAFPAKAEAASVG